MRSESPGREGRKSRGTAAGSEVLTSMGLTGVEGKGCRYSGCKMCPVRAVSIFKTLMGRRLAWRSGSEGGTAWKQGLAAALLPLFPACPFGPERSAALRLRRGLPPGSLRLLLRLLLLIAESEGDVIMTQNLA